MSNKDSLFELVHSLSAAEKGYIIKSSKLHSDIKENSTIKIFKIYCGHTQLPDDKAIMHELNYKGNSNKFAVAKNYTYNYVLKVLTEYHNSPRIEVQRITAKADVLLNKSLYKQALKQLDKAEKQALEFEYFDLLLYIYDLRLTIFMDTAGKKDNFLALHHEKLVGVLTNLKAYFSAKISLADQRISALYKPDTEIQGYNYKEPALSLNIETKRKKKGFFETYFINLIESMIYFQKGDFEKLKQNTKKGVLLWKENPAFTKLKPDNYCAALHNYCSALDDEKENTDWKKTILEAQRLVTDGLIERPFVKYGQNFYILKYACYSGDEKTGNEAFEFFANEFKLQKEIHLIPTVQIRHYYPSLVWCIYCGNYKRAYFYLNELLSMPVSDYMFESHSEIRILSLVLYFETQKFELLESRFHQVEAFLRKNKLLHNTEKLILHTFKQIMKNGYEINKDLCDEFKKEYYRIIKHTSTSQKDTLFDYGLWISAHFNNSNMINYLKKQRITW